MATNNSTLKYPARKFRYLNVEYNKDRSDGKEVSPHTGSEIGTSVPLDMTVIFRSDRSSEPGIEKGEKRRINDIIFIDLARPSVSDLVKQVNKRINTHLIRAQHQKISGEAGKGWRREHVAKTFLVSRDGVVEGDVVRGKRIFVVWEDERKVDVQKDKEGVVEGFKALGKGKKMKEKRVVKVRVEVEVEMK
jgi:hypothetical protein